VVVVELVVDYSSSPSLFLRSDARKKGKIIVVNRYLFAEIFPSVSVRQFQSLYRDAFR
jgi:hypothetical protein